LIAKYTIILKQLKAIFNPKAIKGMARFGIAPQKTFGVSIPDLRKIAKDTIKKEMQRNLIVKIMRQNWKSTSSVLIISFLIILSISCSQARKKVIEIAKYSLDSLEGVITQSGVFLDRKITSNGKGSLRMAADKPAVIRLFETGDLDIEDARLVYRAKVRCENIEGQVFLEMWCQFPGKGEFFSRGLHNTISGTTDWTSLEAYFFLKKGENPENIRLNLVINGTGIAWIDDIRLNKGPLK
jgi:hypothetical protein